MALDFLHLKVLPILILMGALWGSRSTGKNGVIRDYKGEVASNNTKAVGITISIAIDIELLGLWEGSNIC